MTDKPKPNPAARALGRRRAKVLGKERMSEIGKMGGLAARGKSGRKPSPRCACGKYTEHVAEKRGHKCKLTDVIYSCCEFRCPKCKRFIPHDEKRGHKCEAITFASGAKIVVSELGKRKPYVGPQLPKAET